MDWYRQLRATQQATRQSIPGQHRARRTALDADARLLDAEIRRLSPGGRAEVVWTLALVLILLIVLVYFLALRNGAIL